MFILRDLLHWLFRYRLKLIVLFAAAVWGAVWVWPRPAGWPRSAGWPWSNRLNIVFCSVGQGDAAIVILGFTQVLIDAGPASPRASDCLDRHLPFFDHQLEAVIISHPQADHFGGLATVLNRYQVDKFIFNGYAGDSRAWADLSGLIEKEDSQIITLAAGDKLKIGEIEIDVLWPEAGSKGLTFASQRLDLKSPNEKVLGVASTRDLNADALVLKLAYGNFSTLFTGDISVREENALLNNQQLTINNLSILKVPHHGSKTSSSAEFLEAVHPALAVIEVGKNSYGHPADEVLERLKSVGARILRTDRDGDVVVETDGKRWETSTISN